MMFWMSQFFLGLFSIDYEKVFDRIEHQFLWKTLESFGLGSNLIRLIKVMYHNIESMLKVNGGLSAPFNISRGMGVRYQECYTH